MLLMLLQHVETRVISYKVTIKRIILKKFNIDAVTLWHIECIFKFSKWSPNCPLYFFLIQDSNNDYALHLVISLVSFNLLLKQSFYLFSFLICIDILRCLKHWRCRIFHNLDLSDYFLIIKFRLNTFVKTAIWVMLIMCCNISQCSLLVKLSFISWLQCFHHIILFPLELKNNPWDDQMSILSSNNLSPDSFNIHYWSLPDLVITVMVTEQMFLILFWMSISWHPSVPQCFSFSLFLHFSIIGSLLKILFNML